MAKKQFKTESKRLLDLMINSIYTNKEIFLRELISNSSDALDKRHYMSLTDSRYNASDPLTIYLEIDQDARTLSIEDNGIGMTKEELETNLGTIAHSGSDIFKEELEKGNDIDIIGQFGVGFYSSFMVADKVVVESCTVDGEGNRWTSNGRDGYTIEPCDREKVGTKVTLYLREDAKDYQYSDFLDSYKVETLVKKYSDYIRYPIQMNVETTILKEGSEDEYETVLQLKTLNSMVPLWRRNKKDITAEDYNTFYRNKFYDFNDPQKVIHYSVEGNVSYTALLFIPSKIPYDYYSANYEGGLQLYSKGVFIMDHNKDLIPEYFGFVKGLIDSDDVSLNISREILQQDAQLKSLKTSITKKIRSTLVDMLTKEREEYETFFRNFGTSLKYGTNLDYGMYADDLKDLLLFYSSYEDKFVTLKEYRERMKEGQKEIYYCSGATIDQIKKQPQMEGILDKGYEVLYALDDIDEFVFMMIRDYDGMPFRSAQQEDTDLGSEEEKQAIETLAKDNEKLLNTMKSALSDKVSDVKISSRLKSNPVCLVAGEGISMEMEKYLSRYPQGVMGAKANKILEINPNHEVFTVLQQLEEKAPEKVGEYSDLLYQQALLIEGFPLEDPVEFSNRICELMKAASE